MNIFLIFFHISKSILRISCCNICKYVKNGVNLCRKTYFQDNGSMKIKEMDKEEVLEKLSELFSVLNEEERNQLIESMSVRIYRKNEVIYHEGETPRQLMCLVTGKVKIYKDGVGRSQIVRVVKPVEYFGYRAAFSQQAFVTAAAAFEPSLIVKFPLTIIEKFIQNNTALAWFFVRELAIALGKSDERTVNLTQKHVRARLAESLLFLKESYGVEEDGCTLSIYLSREDLANLSNMTTSNAIRTLSLFAQEKLIAIDGRKIKIIQEEELRRISAIG